LNMAVGLFSIIDGTRAQSTSGFLRSEFISADLKPRMLFSSYPP
jgi:hypothetical protein